MSFFHGVCNDMKNLVSGNLNLENALEVMIAACTTDQVDLLDSAFAFALQNKGRFKESKILS